MRRTTPLSLFLAALLAAPAHALYIRPDLEKVPIDRLVENLEALVNKIEPGLVGWPGFLFARNLHNCKIAA